MGMPGDMLDLWWRADGTILCWNSCVALCFFSWVTLHSMLEETIVWTFLFYHQPAQVCSNCGVNMGSYFCQVCNFYDDEVNDLSFDHFSTPVCSLLVCILLPEDSRWRILFERCISLNFSDGQKTVPLSWLRYMQVTHIFFPDFISSASTLPVI